MGFSFENLKVYQKALEFVDEVFDVGDGLPSSAQSSLGDQLRRSSLSIVNNIAEGSDQSSKKKKAVFYEISLHSARECVPGITILKRRGLITEDRHDALRAGCSEICRMLVGLIRSLKL